jgi:hypothetical protein
VNVPLECQNSRVISFNSEPGKLAPVTVPQSWLASSSTRHKIDTLGGVFCFLGCPRTPKSQTGCPRGHPKILQGCPFDTPKKLRVSPVLVGNLAAVRWTDSHNAVRWTDLTDLLAAGPAACRLPPCSTSPQCVSAKSGGLAQGPGRGAGGNKGARASQGPRNWAGGLCSAESAC